MMFFKLIEVISIFLSVDIEVRPARQAFIFGGIIVYIWIICILIIKMIMVRYDDSSA
ncbi:MAG: hypothetical protein QXT84_01335 [Candidatus Bathyarchaeia archaeon]